MVGYMYREVGSNHVSTQEKQKLLRETMHCGVGNMAPTFVCVC